MSGSAWENINSANSVIVNVSGSDGSVIISSSATSVPEGSSLTLNCTYTGNDLVRGIQWVNNGNNMGRKYDIAIEQSKPCSILRIPGLNQTLFNYTCFTLTVFNVTRNNQSDNFKCAAITGVTISSENSVIVNVTVPISTVELTSPTETYVTLNAGELKNFRCRTSGGLPKPTVEWYKTYGYNCNRNGIKITTNMSSLPSAKNGLIEVESSLHFNASSLDNTLWICCAASNVNSQWELSRSKQLEIRHPPPSPPVIDNFIAMSYFKMIENSTERLTCTSTGGNPLASLAWSCNNGIESYPNKSDGSVSRSISWTARRNQDPICTCTATHEAGPPQLVNMHISVMYPPSIPKFKVNGIQVGTTISLINGSTETVECHSSGNPYPSANDFTWRKGKVVVSSNSNSSWIGGIKIQDGGSYKCSVTTTMTPSDTKQSPVTTIESTNATIDVLYSPRLHKLQQINALEGETLTVKCEYMQGNPGKTTVLISRLNDGTNWTKSTHVLQSLKRNDAGLYSCTVRNTMQPTGQNQATVGEHTRHFNVNVWYNTSVALFGLTSHPNEINVTVDENTPLNFFCKVDSNPNSTIILGRSDNVALTKRDGVLHLSFHVQKAGCLDTGRYFCYGYNNYTEAWTAPREHMNVFVRCSPRSSGGQTESNVTGVFGGNATFSLDVVAYPVPSKEGYVWHKWNGATYSQVDSNAKYSVNNSGNSTTFTIKSIEEEDFSTYLLTVSNGVNPKFSKTFNLSPQGVPQCPTGLIASLTTSSSVTIEWVSHFNGGFKQTFVILYKTIESSEYLVLTENELDKKTKNTKTISRLKDGSTYDIILFSRNAIGNCRQNTSIQIETDLLVDDPPPSYSTLIVGLAGGIPAVCVVVVVVAVVIVVVLRKRRSYKKRETRHVLAQGQKQQSLNAVDEDSDDIPNEVENPMYDGFECSAARQDPRDVLYTLPKKKGGDIYTVVDKKTKRLRKSQDSTNQKMKGNEIATKENFNSDGLVYADTVFADQPKGQTLRGTHGGGDTTVYADVDLTKKAKTLPESDGEDGVKRETIQQ
ncbi:nephrin-like [Mya arenaria]|uniref:nephrin-like n=1 Tax=Mya arenaria TaxID=6604 RepID=UPI0022E186D7|nr:nephrin-like [Mya arenaria]